MVIALRADLPYPTAASDDCSPFSDYQYYIHSEWGNWRFGRSDVADNSFLTHVPFPVDHAVWLTPEDVAVGRDTVVEAAVEWILTLPE